MSEGGKQQRYKTSVYLISKKKNNKTGGEGGSRSQESTLIHQENHHHPEIGAGRDPAEIQRSTITFVNSN